MPQSRRLYLSGPIASEPNWIERFRTARFLLIDQGYAVICPAEQMSRTGGRDAKKREEHMKRDIEHVLSVDEVCLLSGWRNSIGCMVEVFVAWQTGLRIWEFDTGKEVKIDASVFDKKFLNKMWKQLEAA
jgi:nucleoside 2-deoxyribosyltransferase